MAKPRFKMQKDKSILVVVDVIPEPKPSPIKRLLSSLKRK